MLPRWLRVYVIPAGVFQSVIVGGAYGTGREVAEYLSRFGPLGGLYACGLIILGFALVIAASFEFARLFQTWDYRGFVKCLLGPGWMLYEICFVTLLVIALAVTGAAAGEVLADRFGIDRNVGTLLMLAAVVFFNYFGRRMVELSLAAGSVALTVTLVGLVGYVFTHHGGTILERLAGGGVEPGWPTSALKFMIYNSALVPVLLYSASELETRRQAIVSGIVTGLAGALPALVFHLSFMSHYPEIIAEKIPAYWLIQQFGQPWFLVVYVVVLFVTIVQTGVGILQGVNERLDAWWRESRGRPLGHGAQAAIATGAVLVSLACAKLGIVALVAQGYGSLAYGFALCFTLPVLTIGLARIRRAGAAAGPHP